MDVKSSHWWQSGDGKIISVAEEKSFLSLRSQTNTPGLNPKTMLIKARKHLEQGDCSLQNKDIYLYFSEIATEDKQPLRMREPLEYQRFRV